MKQLKQPSKLLKPAVLALAIVAVFVSGAFTPLEPAMVVVIDAGHGGKDPGNLGTGRYSLTEKDVTLDVSNKLAEYIRKNMPDVKVILTRTGDSFPKLSSRVKIANNAEADVFISIHCDAFTTENARGCGTYVMGMHKTEESLNSAMRENASIFKEDNYEDNYEGFDPNDPDTYIALSLRQNVFLDNSLQLGSLIQNQFRDKVGRKDRGVRQAGYYVISFTSMPSVLVELGFLTNPNEEDFLQSEDGRTYMASALFRAFREYRDIHKPQITNEPIVEPETETKPQHTDGVTFSVQIASSSTELDKSDPVFRGLQNVDMYLSGGQYKYTTGLFGVAEDAHVKKRELRDQGFSGAFVAAFKDGKRVPMSSILEEIKTP
ncbi:MAG: N-acetylmuramoyl-L-alanine amidase [Bacteroidetes bacterium]|jgi:N-acetylmuramoyl-L-alanine amidase|nr:N-acetylmuramoyl-L-alanine amidase [Bacteroidota bacterium]